MYVTREGKFKQEKVHTAHVKIEIDAFRRRRQRESDKSSRIDYVSTHIGAHPAC